ncbi:hypothetical protein [Pantoea sp. GM01]|uniref:hypothetical protein n=1 Tax=Pantoea sp. GM01 TaxID=1144320 RepID=UPI000270E8FF|nr:hypothetical protein [Pantoea sp. GM01]EJL93138.1 hypothetical protein PMI17_00407 [Pantoea sp. GM01]
MWLILPAVLVVHAWLVRADPAGIARSLINSEKRRLDHMLTLDYLKDGADTLFKRELRQRSLWKLTRLFNHRLQDLAVEFALHWNVRANYLSLWRTWLSERDGKIHFSHTWYERFLWMSWLNILVSTGLMVAILVLLFKALIAWKAMVIAFMLVNFIWLPWMIFTMVPFRSATREMFDRVEAFNALEKSSRGRSNEKSQQAEKVTV